jgi:alpha-ketoglutarate-dependent taurine dioxygenase
MNLGSERALSVKTAEGDNLLCVDVGEKPLSFEARWLRAFAPFVAKPLGGEATTAKVGGQGGLLEQLAMTSSKHWRGEHKVSKFELRELETSDEKKCEFLETMATEGIAAIDGLVPDTALADEAGRHFEQDVVGKPLADLVRLVGGKMYQHPRRHENWFSLRSKAKWVKNQNDYKVENFLAMHTDHSFIENVPGYLQFMWQVNGSYLARACDGFAIAEDLRVSDPEAFRLLTTVPVTHSLRTMHYSVDGKYIAPTGEFHEGIFEECLSHPIIELSETGAIRRVAHTETKRGACAIDFESFEGYMAAYQKWMAMVEDPKYVIETDWSEHKVLVYNNWRVLHGRGIPTDAKERVVAGGYLQKHLAEMRYRLLKQREIELKGLSGCWTTRIPNQVLSGLLV